jgi:hypothetical protein
VPQVRMEARRTDVLDICHRWRHKQINGRSVCAVGWRLTALMGGAGCFLLKASHKDKGQGRAALPSSW